MNSLSLKQILELPDNTALEGVQGLISEVYKPREVKGGKRVQNAILRDASGVEVRLSVWDHEPIDTYKGQEVIIQSGPKGGLKASYDNYNKANNISISRTATFQFLKVHNAQSAGAAQATATTGGAADASQQKNSAIPIVVNGAKVGMALNNACQFLVASGEPFSSQKVFEIASELVRISNKMEQGELAEAAH